VLRAIYLDGRHVGVALVGVETGTPYLVRFIVDARHQRAGIGRRAVELLVDKLPGCAGWRSLETSFLPGAGGAAAFWRRCGFRATGRELHGEPVVVREV
jgi:diamine N-acetyltransferase